MEILATLIGFGVMAVIAIALLWVIFKVVEFLVQVGIFVLAAGAVAWGGWELVQHVVSSLG